MNEKDNLQFDLDSSTILIKLTSLGEEIIKNLDPNDTRTKNEDGYYLLFTTDLFALFRSLLLRDSFGKITDIVDGPVLIPSLNLNYENGMSLRN